ncbi:hypothetical protein ACLM44_07990 [Synechococcus sp. W2B2]|uniref:hypothetical protein n=1 Tax=unclassified Synechococcus TaxID=2626047 RepID=UPI0012E9CE59|nr:hypothetical protein [Synechococcus sp. WH 7805]
MLLKSLHYFILSCGRSALHLPESDEAIEGLDLQTLILKEAIAARNDQQAQLSLDLLETAIEHGFDSCWMLNNKALALRQMGDLAGAIAVWSDLADLDGPLDFTEKVKGQLEAAQEQLVEQQREQSGAVLTALHGLLDQAKRSALHLPVRGADADDLDLQTLILKEAIAARNDQQAQLSLDLLETAIEHGFDSCWMLNNKALALRQMGDLAGAIAVWSDLANLDELSGFTEKVKGQLEATQELLAGQQREQAGAVLTVLHGLLDQAKRSALHLPVRDADTEGLNLQTLILKEAISARNDQQAQLSLDLLETAIEHGFDSLWLVHNKALALREMGDLAGAITVWSDLANLDGLPEFTEKVKGQLEATQELLAGQQREQAGAVLTALHGLLDQAKRSALHLPIRDADTEGLNLQTLILKEAIAARNDQQLQLSLDLLETAIEHGFDSLWLVHNKALALRQMGDLAGAIAVWSDLANLDGLPEFTEKVKGQLEATQELLAGQQREQAGAVLTALHGLLDQAKRSALHLPIRDADTEGLNLQTLILKEAIAARNDQQLQLSLDLLETAIEHGFDSLWLVHNKALALRQMGDLAGAIAVWSDLADLDGLPEFTEKVKGQLEATQELLAGQQREQAGAVLTALHGLLDQAKRSALHLPVRDADTEGLNLQTLILKEAIAARNDQQLQLSLDLLETAIEHGFDSLWLVHNKALALRQMGDLAGAIAVWSDLADLDGLPEFTEQVNEQLQATQELLAEQPRRQAGAVLIALHVRLDQAKRSALHLPVRDADTEDLDLVKLILKEAFEARRDGQAQLSIDLLEIAIEHNFDSLWLFHYKALALRDLSKFDAALRIWTDLSVHRIKGFSEQVQRCLDEVKHHRVLANAADAERSGNLELAINVLVQALVDYPDNEMLNAALAGYMRKRRSGDVEESDAFQTAQYSDQLDINSAFLMEIQRKLKLSDSGD